MVDERLREVRVPNVREGSNAIGQHDTYGEARQSNLGKINKLMKMNLLGYTYTFIRLHIHIY